MSKELIRDNIVLDKKMGKENTQILLEGDIIVPDIKPDMSVILQSDSDIFINNIEISNDRINFMGRLDITVLYLAKGANKPVHSINVSENIDNFINLEGITKDMWADINATINSIDYKMLNDRKINYRAVVDISVVSESHEYHEVVIDVEDIPQNQTLKKNLEINKSIENTIDRFIVKDELSIPLGKPGIREVLQCTISVNNKESKVLNGKVNISGQLLVTVLYKGDDDSSMVEFIENEIPFNGVVDSLNAKDYMFADTILNIEDKFVQIKTDIDGEDRILEIETTVFAVIKVSHQESIEILEDAYIINNDLKITKMPVKYSQLVCRNKNQTTFKEIVQTEQDSPEMLQIYRITGKPHLETVKPLGDKIMVEGIIEANILYVAESDDAPLYSYNTTIPYQQVIETKGTTPDMDVNVSANIDHVGFNMLSGKEVEVRFLLSFNTQVNEQKELNMITDIEIEEMTPEYLNSFASVTVYCVQKGDTLWKIAKRYNTSIEEIIEMNNLAGDEKLTTGAKIILLKKVVN